MCASARVCTCVCMCVWVWVGVSPGWRDRCVRQASALGAVMAKARAAAPKLNAFVTVVSAWNNTFVSVSNLEGQVITKASGGSSGFKGAKKSSSAAAQAAATQAATAAVAKGFDVADVRFRGPTRARGFALRGISAAGMRIGRLEDISPIHTNGTRPRKTRRL